MLTVGDTLPSSTLRTMGSQGPETLESQSFFAHKRVVLFGVPGAFTPGCTRHHLPGYAELYPRFQALNIDLIACVANNDVFVMDNWAEHHQVKGKILMLSDDGTWRDTLNMRIDLSAAGLGIRIRRFAAILDNNIIQYIGVETGKDIQLSAAETLLAFLEKTPS
jgi:peroxiredoxin